MDPDCLGLRTNVCLDPIVCVIAAIRYLSVSVGCSPSASREVVRHFGRSLDCHTTWLRSFFVLAGLRDLDSVRGLLHVALLMLIGNYLGVSVPTATYPSSKPRNPFIVDAQLRAGEFGMEYSRIEEVG